MKIRPLNPSLSLQVPWSSHYQLSSMTNGDLGFPFLQPQPSPFQSNVASLGISYKCFPPVSAPAEEAGGSHAEVGPGFQHGAPIAAKARGTCPQELCLPVCRDFYWNDAVIKICISAPIATSTPVLDIFLAQRSHAINCLIYEQDWSSAWLRNMLIRFRQ